MAVDDREVDALWLMPLELRLEVQRRRALGEQHQPRTVAIDAMHDERPPAAARRK